MTVEQDSLNGVIDTLRAAWGPERVSTDLSDRLAVSRGTWPVELKWQRLGLLHERAPAAVAWPETTAEVQQILELASEYRIPLIPVGGASGIVGGFQTEPSSIAIDLKRLQRLDLDPISMTVWAGAGVNLHHLEDWVQARGFTTGHFPQSMHSATVGGMVATNGIGTFSTKYGRMQDMVKALEVVLADGRRIETSEGPSASVGPELFRLFVGSEGTLGIVTAAQLQVWRRPECRILTSYSIPTTEQGLDALHEIMAEGLAPALVRLYDEDEAEWTWRGLGEQPGPALLILGQEGRADITQLEMRICREILERHGAALTGERPANYWFAHRFSTARMLETNLRPGGISDAIEVSAPWAQLTGVWRAMKEAAAPLCTRLESHFSHLYHVGGSVYVIFYAQADDDRAAIDLYSAILGRLLEASLAAGGNASHHHGIGTAKIRWFKQQLGTGYTILEDIKKALDPRSILVPGVLGLGGKANV